MADTGVSVWAAGFWADDLWSAGLWSGALAPTITTQPQPQTVLEPAPATFTVAATTSGGTLTYQWQEDDGGGYANLAEAGAYSGVTSDTMTIDPTEAVLDGYLYRVVVTDDNGSATSSGAALTVQTENPPSAGSTGNWPTRIRRFMVALCRIQ